MNNFLNKINRILKNNQNINVKTINNEKKYIVKQSTYKVPIKRIDLYD